MKIRLRKKELESIIKEEAIKLKTKKILKESVHSKINRLESKIQSVIKEMKSIYSEEEILEDEHLTEFFGFGKLSKAEKAYKERNADKLSRLKKAYKTYSPEYIEISTELLDTLRKDVRELMSEFGISNDDFRALYSTLKDIVQPMNFTTFKQQAEKGGFRMGDIASGAKGSSIGK